MSATPDGWIRTEFANVADVGQYGTVREWTHEETGDTVGVEFLDPPTDGGRRRYEIEYNGEAVGADSTLRSAADSAMDTIRENPDGL